jgi:hypothetical protein
MKISANLENNRLQYTNSPQTIRVFRWEPATFELRLSLEDADKVVLALNPAAEILVEANPASGPAWGSGRTTRAELENGFVLKCKAPDATPPPGPLQLEVTLLEAGPLSTLAKVTYPITIVWIGHSGFDPAVHGYPFVNSGAAYGQVSLDRKIFDRTFGALVLGRERLFRKMYRDILGATVDENGPIAGTAPLSSGLCTGMIRSSLAYYLSRATPPSHDRQPMGETLNTIKLYHGRQLSDRALSQAARWIIWGGPRRVFEAFKKEVLSGNQDPLAFDIGVAAWGRKDFWRAIQAEGHTVIPYAFRQDSPDSGEIFIYNPNNPADSDDYGYANAPEGHENRLEKHAIHFDLTKNTYYYTDHYQSVRPNGDATTIIAVHQSAYEKGRSALISSLANRFI